MTRLLSIGAEAGLDLVAAKWPEQKSIVVPCVVHWKQDHYAAIVGRRQNAFEVVDPVFGKARWMRESDIFEEASGYFIIARDHLPSTWAQVPTEETDQIYGKGYVGEIADDDDACSHGSGGSGPAGETADYLRGDGYHSGGFDCSGCGGGEATGGSGTGCDQCGQAGTNGGNVPGAGGGGRHRKQVMGMPVWEVSEPYMNLWVYDEPLGYDPGLGPRVSFKLAYKQREGSDLSAQHVFSIGPKWNLSWLSYVLVEDEFTATMRVPGGGKRTYYTDGSWRDYYSHATMERVFQNQTNLQSFVVRHGSGGSDVYGFIASTVLIDGMRVAFLTERVNPSGHTLRFQYEEANDTVRLKYVIDGDGRTNTLAYTNASFPAQITAVQDPFTNQVALLYNHSGLLTNVTDVVGLKSAFAYDPQGWMTNLITCYGLTTFTHWTNNTGITEFGPYGEPGYIPYLPIRAVTVHNAVGGKHVYLLRQDSSLIFTNLVDAANGTNGVDFIGDDYFTIPAGLPYNQLETGGYAFRNSFHWGPNQAASLPDDLTTFTLADYRRARLRHWLHSLISVVGYGISHSLSIEQLPSPDGTTPGAVTWLDYENKLATYYQGGTMVVGAHVYQPSLPWLVARSLPDGSTWYKSFVRNPWSKVTDETTTYCTSLGGAVTNRTKTFVYNPYDLGEINLNAILHMQPGTGPFYDGSREWSFAYNDRRQVVRATNALQQVAYYTYDNAGRLTSARTPAGLTTTNIYFASGGYTNWVQMTIDLEIGRTNSYTYKNNNVYTHTDERGLTTTNIWDALGRLVAVLYPDGTTISNLYHRLDSTPYANSSGGTNILDLTATRDRMGNWTHFAYDALRRRTAVTNALGYFTLYNHCSCGGLDSIRDAAGNTTQFYYDNAGRRVQTVYPDSFVENYFYNALGQLTNTTDSAGGSLTRWYLNQGVLGAVSNAFGLVQYTIYDIEDRAIQTIDANGVTTTLNYDELGRIQTRTHPDNGLEAFAYSERGLAWYTNQLTNVTFYAHDEAGRKILEVNPNAETNRFHYDASGNLTNLVDAKGQQTTWKYDLYGRVTNKVDNLSQDMFRYGYDANGRLTNRWSPGKGTTAYAYDGVGNLTNINYPASPDIALAYDSLNRVTNMVDAAGATAYSFNSAGQLLWENGPWAQDTVSYSYQNRLRSTAAVEAPNASPWVVGYGYDSIKRLTNVTSPAGTFGYSYTGAGQNLAGGSLVGGIALPGGSRIDHTFDSVGRLLSTALKNSQLVTLNSHAYTYNVGSQRTRQTRTHGDYVDYTYDPAGQLIRALGSEEGGSPGRLQEQHSYVYDRAGNLEYRTNYSLVQGFGINSLNQLTNGHRLASSIVVAGSASGTPTNVLVWGTGLASGSAQLYGDGTWARSGATLADGNNTYTAVAQDALGRVDTNSSTCYLPVSIAFAYDANGNLTNDGRRVFYYDDENQLIAVLVSNAWKSEFTYDGKMRRRERRECAWSGGAWVTNSIVRYIYDGNLVIQERHFDPQLSTLIPQQVVSYTRGKDLSGSLEGAGGIGGLLARSSSSDVAYPHAYYHADGNGNVTALVSTNQVLVAQYVYDPYGNILGQHGPLAEANLYRFSSKEFHENSGLVYYLYRFYEPSLQRWMNRDPIEEDGGANLYRFNRNVPNSEVDPFGLVGPVDTGTWPPIFPPAPPPLEPPEPPPTGEDGWVKFKCIKIGTLIPLYMCAPIDWRNCGAGHVFFFYYDEGRLPVHFNTTIPCKCDGSGPDIGSGKTDAGDVPMA